GQAPLTPYPGDDGLGLHSASVLALDGAFGRLSAFRWLSARHRGHLICSCSKRPTRASRRSHPPHLISFTLGNTLTNLLGSPRSRVSRGPWLAGSGLAGLAPGPGVGALGSGALFSSCPSGWPFRRPGPTARVPAGTRWLSAAV